MGKQANQRNKTKSLVRVRVEHVFGAQSNDMDGTPVRTIRLVRAKATIGIKNLACNIRQLASYAASIRSGHEKGGVQVWIEPSRHCVGQRASLVSRKKCHQRAIASKTAEMTSERQ